MLQLLIVVFLYHDITTTLSFQYNMLSRRRRKNNHNNDIMVGSIITTTSTNASTSKMYFHKKVFLSSDDNNNNNNNNNRESSSTSRRQVCISLLSTILTTFYNNNDDNTLMNHHNQHKAMAIEKVKGAAEYDFEFYMRDLVQGNNKEGNIVQSKAPPLPPPRKMTSFVRNIINDSVDESCITVSLLYKIISQQQKGVSIEDISTKIINFRQKVYKVFQSKEPWDNESIQDEYYFDLSCYALYRIAAELIPSNYVLRDQWVRDIGKEIYTLIMKQDPRLVKNDDGDDNHNQNKKKTKTKLTDTIPLLIQILDSFQSTGLIKSYRLGEKNDDIRSGTNIFDEYDNEDIQAGLNFNLIVSIIRPATLGSALQITGEGSRFSPDFVSPTIAAMFENELQLKVDYEAYFVDEEYRPNPKDFFPDEQLLQFTLSRVSAKK